MATTKRRGKPLGSVNKPRFTKVTLKRGQNTTIAQKLLIIHATDDDYDQRLEKFLTDIVDNPRVYKSKNLIEEKDIKMTEWSDESYSFYEILLCKNYDFGLFDEEAQYAIKTNFLNYKK